MGSESQQNAETGPSVGVGVEFGVGLRMVSPFTFYPEMHWIN
jgi:hypothetical protein